MKAALGDLARLKHILEAIHYIEVFLNGKTKDDLTGKAPHTEWKKIIAFRNFIIHEYFGLDLELVWDIIQTKIPVLKIEILALIEQIEVP